MTTLSMEGAAPAGAVGGREEIEVNTWRRRRAPEALYRIERSVMTEKWLRITDVENAVDNLEMAVHFLSVLENEIKWKWVIISVHHALYGFAVSSIWGSDSRSVVTQTKKGHDRLITFDEAIKAAKDPARMIRPGSVALSVTTDEADNIRRLGKHFRDKLMHFQPMHWSIEVSGMPELVRSVVGVVRRLAIECRSVYYNDDNQTTRVVCALDKLESLLASQSV